MYIPDLFGAYVKGRELAIQKNWDDLKNFESIENARNENDLSAMDIWERRQQMPGKMNMFNNNVAVSQMNTDLARETHPGLMAQARMGSGHAQDQFSIWQANRDYGRNVMGRNYLAGLGMLDAAARHKAGQADHWLTNNRAYNTGGNFAKQADYTQLANTITASHLPTTAVQQNNQSDLQYVSNMYGLGLGIGQTMNAIDALSDEHKLYKTDLANRQFDAGNYQSEKAEAKQAQAQQMAYDQVTRQAEVMNYLNPGSGWAWLAQQYGIDIPGVTPATGAATTADGQTASATGGGASSTAGATSPPVNHRQRMLYQMFKNPAYSNYPVSPEHGVYRPLLPIPAQTPPRNDVGAYGGSGSTLLDGGVFYY